MHTQHLICLQTYQYIWIASKNHLKKKINLLSLTPFTGFDRNDNNKILFRYWSIITCNKIQFFFYSLFQSQHITKILLNMIIIWTTKEKKRKKKILVGFIVVEICKYLFSLLFFHFFKFMVNVRTYWHIRELMNSNWPT